MAFATLAKASIRIKRINMGFNYQFLKREEGLVIEFKGRILDKSDATEMYQRFEEKIELGEQLFFVDLSQIDYMNSGGLNILISMLNLCRNHYGKLVLCGATEKVKQLIITSKLQQIFTLEDSLEEAFKNHQ
tara:strand:- start:177 stop:572 length:396 start_codon:yes stop_codon:yes gene_type:complete